MYARRGTRRMSKVARPGSSINPSSTNQSTPPQQQQQQQQQFPEETVKEQPKNAIDNGEKKKSSSVDNMIKQISSVLGIVEQNKKKKVSH